jgi:glycosyltransferase involved in cell wall biosynthesis
MIERSLLEATGAAEVTSPGTVLFLSHDASRTGAPIMLLNFLRWLRQNRDIQFRILVGKSGSLLADFEAIAPVDSFEPDHAFWYKSLRRLKCHGQFLSKHRGRLRESLLNKNIHLVYANSLASAQMIEFVSFLDCPVICHVHEPNMSIRELGIHVLNLVKRRTSIYIAVSQSVKKCLVENCKIPERQIHLILGCAEVSEQPAITDPYRDVRRELGISSQAKIVSACGSIEFRKGTDLFLQIAYYVSKKYNDFTVHFVWIGGGYALVSRMRKQAARLGLKNRVHFVGETSSVAPYLEASDVFLLTSRDESLSLVMLEAASCKKPIICFDQSGHPPEFVEQDAGFVVPDFDTTKMGDRLIELLANPGLCRRLGMAAKHKVTTRYDFGVSAWKIAEIIKDTIQLRYDKPIIV